MCRKSNPESALGHGNISVVYASAWVLGREETGKDSLIVNFDTDLRSSFFAKLYQHSKLRGGHVIMLGSDQASRCSLRMMYNEAIKW